MADDIYLGRIVSIGMNKDGRLAAMYRVSSRSFPNRRAQMKEDGTVAIVPREGHEGDVFVNPYIAYNCLSMVGNVAVVTNGAQTDFIAEKLAGGTRLRDAIAYPLLALDYEKDKYDTPRIVAAVERERFSGYLGVVRKDGVEVVEIDLKPGQSYHVSTYEHNRILPETLDAFDAKTADDCCRYVLGEGAFASFTSPVSAVCAIATADGFDVSAMDAPPQT